MPLTIRRPLACIAAILPIWLLPASPLHAQTYDLSWNTIDGGGAMLTTGGAFQLSGTIGQPDAGSAAAPLTGGAFQLVGGFWPGAGSTCASPSRPGD